MSAGGVGFDISCGVRLLATSLTADDIVAVQKRLAHELSRAIPAGVGSKGRIALSEPELLEMLAGGAAWAVAQGFGVAEDLERIEEQGRMAGATPEVVSEKGRRRQLNEMGTLGSGNHYLEVQRVAEILDADAARTFGLAAGQAVVMIHCGSRGGSGTRSAPSTCARWQSRRPRTGWCCPTASSPARRLPPSSASATSG